MKSLHHHRLARNAAKMPTLFDWANEHELVTLPFPASVLAKRYGLNPQRAALVAELAGLGSRQ